MPAQDQVEQAKRRWRQSMKTLTLMGVDFVALPRADAPGEADRVVDVETQPPPPRAEELATLPPTRAELETGDLFGGAPAQPRPGEAISVEIKSTVRDDWRATRAERVGELNRDEARRLLDAVRAKYEADAPHARFVTDHHSIVFGEGDPCARLMFVGEAPGADEDRLGRPFVGRAGQLLDRIITAMGLKREEVYIANVLKTRPPNNATPTAVESELCAPYLMDQIRVICPEVIVTLGIPASRVLLKSMSPMGAMRGRWWTFEESGAGCGVPEVLGLCPTIRAWVMPTYHPAYLLRNYTEADRAKVWSDMKMVLQRLGLQAPVRSRAESAGEPV